MDDNVLNRFYFTFGTDIKFPFYTGWVEVIAEDRNGAIALFRKHFKDRRTDSPCVNCSFIYDETEWARVKHAFTSEHRHAVLSGDSIYYDSENKRKRTIAQVNLNGRISSIS